MSDLNPSQRAAVEHDTGPMLVLAGAGSGKTRVVTTRIGRLLERGVLARSILAMTFTNKAAEEMHERVSRLVGAKIAKELLVSTFHSFGMKVLAAETQALGFRHGEFTIFDQADCGALVRELLRSVNTSRKYDIPAIMARISHAKNHFLGNEQLLEREGDEYDEITKILFPRYRAALRNFQAFDFDDLVCEPVRLFQMREDVRQRWIQRFRYLMVDEYQDTNRAQLELVRLLAGDHQNVCVVGDDDQSIYAWRGADITNILHFESHFPGAKIVKLEENYRSAGSILAVANAVLAKSQAKRHAKVLKATRAPGRIVQQVNASEPEVEASFICDEMRRLNSEHQIPFRDMAILYRSNRQNEPLESALRERGIPFQLFGGTQFYDRKEVKDLLAYLKVAINPRDEIALRRVINYPSRGIGESAFERIETVAVARNMPLFDVIERADMLEGLSGSAQAGCRQFVSALSEAKERLHRGSPASEVTQSLAESIGLRADILDASASGDAASRRWGNIEMLLRVLTRHDQRVGTTGGEFAPAQVTAKGGPLERLAELLRILTLRQEDEEAKTNAVTMTTMHGAKGLEFPVVFIAGLDEGLMPHTRAIEARATDVNADGASNDIEEERRLFYVSVTRAKDWLYLCRTSRRMVRGKPLPQVASRFLLEIPDALLEKRDVSVAAAPSTLSMAARGEALLAALGKLDAPLGPAPRRR